MIATEDGNVAEADVVRHCRDHLAPFKVPRTVVFLTAEQLPTTSTGKVQKYLLVQGRLAGTG